MTFKLSMAFGDDPFRGLPIVTTLNEINDYIISKVLVDLAPFL